MARFQKIPTTDIYNEVIIIKMVVDLNCDMGESFGAYKLGWDEEAVKYISSANIACGFHAGDPLVMAQTVDLAVNQVVAVGAHPAYPDLLGFGRRNMEATPSEIRNYVIYQTGALLAFAKVKGAMLQHVKPHGALYNTAAVNIEVARAIAQAIFSVDPNLIFLVLANSEMEKAACETGLRYAREVFADRHYNSDGTLMSRSHPHSVITDPAEVSARMVDIIKSGRIKAYDGTYFSVEADSICLHSDTPRAIEHMRHLSHALNAAGIEVKPMGLLV